MDSACHARLVVLHEEEVTPAHSAPQKEAPINGQTSQEVPCEEEHHQDKRHLEVESDKQYIQHSHVYKQVDIIEEPTHVFIDLEMFSERSLRFELLSWLSLNLSDDGHDLSMDGHSDITNRRVDLKSSSGGKEVMLAGSRLLNNRDEAIFGGA